MGILIVAAHRTAGFLKMAGFGAALLLSLPDPAGAVERASANAIKATFLAKFGAFVQWPSGFLAADASLRLCIFEPDPLGPLIDQAARGNEEQGRRIEVVRVSDSARARHCHVLYVPDHTSAEAGNLFRVLRGWPILTVAEGHPAPENPIIRLEIVNQRMAFHIDDVQAAESGLTISSKLLSLALSLSSRRPP